MHAATRARRSGERDRLMFELRAVVKRYAATLALDTIRDDRVRRTTALIGPSAAGKSTVLRMLVGLESAVPPAGRSGPPHGLK